MRVVVIGGHLSPALSVLPHLKEHETLYLGRKYAFEADKALSLEYRVISSLAVNFKNITTGRLQRNFSFQTVLSLLKFPIGFVQSLLILRSFKPDVVLGFGGYVQIPVALSAFILRIPIVIHEQSLGAGLSNKVCSFFAKKVLISWEPSFKSFPRSKTILTGLPLRSEIFETSQSEKSEDKLIYVTGGSSGSHSLNVLIEKNLKELLKVTKIFHQTGEALEFGDFERLLSIREKLPEDLKKRYMVMKFVNSKDAANVLKSADLVISRAGINTISEIIWFAKPSLIIPLPMGKEQEDNAIFLEKLGLAEVLYQQNLTPFQFLNAVESMLRSLQNYKPNFNVQDFTRKNAAEEIAKQALNASKKIQAKTL